jgi:hypothetical protein
MKFMLDPETKELFRNSGTVPLGKCVTMAAAISESNCLISTENASSWTAFSAQCHFAALHFLEA